MVRVVTGDGHDIRPAEPFRPSLRVLSFDIENAIRRRTIFTICGVAEGGGRERSTFRLSGESERKILEDFVRVVVDDDPDVITGYNIGGYDFPLLEERAKATGVNTLALGRQRSAPNAAGDRLWKVTGRVVADVWWSVRRDLRPKQETLQFVARTLLGDSKLAVDRRNIDEEWARDPGPRDGILRTRCRPGPTDPTAAEGDRESRGPGDRRAPPARGGHERPHLAVHRRDAHPEGGREGRGRPDEPLRRPRSAHRGGLCPRDPAGY